MSDTPSKNLEYEPEWNRDQIVDIVDQTHGFMRADDESWLNLGLVTETIREKGVSDLSVRCDPRKGIHDPCFVVDLDIPSEGGIEVRVKNETIHDILDHEQKKRMIEEFA